MYYDAVAVGRNDLTGGLSFLQQQAARTKFAWLSANLVNKSTGKSLFPAYLVRKVGSISIGIIGLTGYDGSDRFLGKEDAALLSWQKVLPDLVAELAAQCDLLILLSNNELKQNQEIAESFPDIHLIIQSTPRSKNFPPQLHNKTLIAQTGKQGKYLGWMLVNWQKSKTWGRAGAAKELATKKQELDGLNGRIGRIERREKKEDLRENPGYQKLLVSRDQLLSEIIFLENEIFDLKKTGQAPSTFENHFIDLDINLPDQPEVKQIVEATKLKVNKAGRNQADTSATSETLNELELEKLSFTGWMTCALCHFPQTEFWKTTDHFSAFQTLTEQEQQFNLNCLPCHVTSQYKDIKISNNETLLLSLPVQLLQVGCEICHGPGKNHAVSQTPSDISRKPDMTICIRCHTSERDEDFNYYNDIERIACPASKK